MRAIKAAVIFVATLFGALATHAASLTYAFSGVMLDGYGFDGQTVVGSLTVDPGLYTHVVGDGSTWAQGYGDNSAGQGLIQGTISLSGGFAMTLGGPNVRFPSAETYVYKNHAGMDEFIVDGATDLNTTTTGFLQLRTTDYIGNPLLMFPEASTGDLSFSQRVRFNTAESFDLGYFSMGNAAGAIASGDFILTSVTGSGVVSAVPEPSSLILLLAGLSAAFAATSRRRFRARP